tara:strand:- start:251 stop:541 length:291 start_codon:yes stop_codon:yes gene_type:complete
MMDLLDTIKGNQNKSLSLSSNVAIEQVDENFIMLELSKGIFFEVNKSAEMIINLIREKKTITQIKTSLQNYSNYNEKVLEDFLLVLLKKKIIFFDD